MKRYSFTLIELLVVISIIAVLAAMLLPALSRAKAMAKHSLCVGQLRQHGIAHGVYQGDNDTFFPNFGGIVGDIGYGRIGTPNLTMMKKVSTGGGLIYLRDYLGQRGNSTKPAREARLAYCPAIEWKQQTGQYPGFNIMDNPSNLGFEGWTLDQDRCALGYFFYTGRKMLYSTHSNNDTLVRRNDGREILVGELLGASDRYEVGAAYLRVGGAWVLNPHEGVDCRDVHNESAHQVLADGSVQTYAARRMNWVVSWGPINYGWSVPAGPANSLTDGPYWRGRDN